MQGAGLGWPAITNGLWVAECDRVISTRPGTQGGGWGGGLGRREASGGAGTESGGKKGEPEDRPAMQRKWGLRGCV